MSTTFSLAKELKLARNVAVFFLDLFDLNIFELVFAFFVLYLKNNITNLFQLEKKKEEKMFIQIKNIWYYNVYILKLKLNVM